MAGGNFDDIFRDRVAIPMVRHSRLILIALAVFATGGPVGAAVIANSDFSGGTEIEISDTTQSIIGEGADVWVLGGHDGGDFWDVLGEVATKTSGSESSGMTQYTEDSKSMTGVATMNFDLNFAVGSGDQDLGLYVMGWQAGETPPTLDYENGTLETGDSFSPNDSVSLITEPTGTEGVLLLVSNSSPNFAGVTDGGGFQPISVDLDFGTGYDFVGVAFHGENGGGTIEIDNVQYATAVIPEPSPVALLAIGVVGGLVGRRRR